MRSLSFYPVVRAVTVGVLCSQLVLPAGVLAQQAALQQSAQRPASAEPSMDMGQHQDAGTFDALVAKHGGVLLEAPVAEALPVMNATVADRSKAAPITGDAKLLLVLNRFTYGPRPGDVEKIREMGLSEWFHRQLNPQSIDDSALNERLQQYPAMQMPLEKMFAEFPSKDAVAASVRGRRGVDGNTGDASGRALFAAQAENYRRRFEFKQQAAQQSKMGEDAQSMTKQEAKKQGKQDEAPVALPATPEQMIAMDPDDRYKMVLKLNMRQLQELRRSLGPDQRGRFEEGMTPRQMETIAAFAGTNELIASEDVQTKLLRDVYSERQLQEVMVDFWLNHFNVYMKKSQPAPYYIAQYQRDVVRPFALGKFSDLLLSTAQSVAMLDYLDQYQSVGPHSQSAMQGGGNQKKGTGLNENYAREVMELHSIGVDGGYTQKDVTELAKVLTGWTIFKGYERGMPTRAVFDPSKHEPGNKVVLGHVIKENGAQEGRDVLLMLAASPQCAHFISQKLAVRFVSDNPPKAVVDRMTAAFLATHGDIRQVLAAMINSPEFFTAANYQNKVKTPQDFVVSAVRATGADVINPSGMAKAMADLGQPMYGHIAPDGYPAKSEAWNSTTALVSRMNFSMALAANRVQGIQTDLDKLMGSSSGTMSAKEKQDSIESRLLHAKVSARTEALIAKETTADPEEQRAQLRDVAAVRGNIRYGKGKNDAPKGGGRNPMGIADNGGGLDLQAALATGLVLGSPEFQRR